MNWIQHCNIKSILITLKSKKKKNQEIGNLSDTTQTFIREYLEQEALSVYNN